MSNRIPKVVRMDLTEADRKCIAYVFSAALALLTVVQGDGSIDTNELERIRWMQDNLEEMSRVAIKLNRDLIMEDPELNQMSQDLENQVTLNIRQELDHIKLLIEAADARAGNAIASSSPFRTSMLWLIEQLEMRL